MIESTLAARLSCIRRARGTGTREPTRVGPWRRGHLRMVGWAIAVLGVTMVAFTGTAAAQTPRLDVFDENVLEGGDIVFKVLLSSSSNQSVTVQYATENGADRLSSNVNAQSGSDFTAASGTLTFAPGETRKTVRVSTTDDRAYEWNEIFYLRLSNPTNARLFGSTATGTIDNDDSPPTVHISDRSATEGDDVEFKVSLSAPTGRAVYVDLKPEVGSGDTAKPLDDFDDRGAELGMVGGTDQKPPSFTVRVATVDDDIDESNETFTVRLSNPRGLVLGDATATGTIVDDDDGTPPPPKDLPTVRILVDPNAAEGRWMTFYVNLSKRSDRQVSVQYATSSGTAQSGTDFTPASGLLVFPAGDTGKVLYVKTTRDSVDEGNETFTLTLSSPIHATLGKATATATITEADTDVDGSPFVAVEASTDAAEGKPVTFTVRLSAPGKKQATVQYEAQGRTCGVIVVNGKASACRVAKSGVDYVATSGTLTFAPSETEKTVSVPTIDDAEYEGKEYLKLQLSNPTNAAFRTLRTGKGSGLVEAGILDNDPAPVASFASQASSVRENAGTHNVTINLSSAQSAAITLNYTEEGGTATHGFDYGLLSGEVSVPAGATTATIPVEIIDDSVDDSGETIVLKLTAGEGYTVGTSHTHTVTIQNHEPAVPTVTVARKAGTASSVTEGASASFTVSASPAPSAPLTVDLTVEQSGDYAAAGETGAREVIVPTGGSATVEVATVADTTDEANGSITAAVDAGTGYKVAAAPNDTATVAVADDDATTVTLSTPDTSAAEGDTADTAEIVLTLGRGLADGETLVAPLQFVGGAAGTLFTLACPTTLPAGVTCQTLDSAPQVTFAGPSSGVSATAVTLSFTARDDTDSDSETVTVSIPASSTGGAPTLTATGLGGGATGSRTGDGQISITDNDVPAPSNPVSLSVSGNGAVDEGDPALTITASLGTANATGSALAIPVQVRTAGTTAAAADYTLAGTISIAAGASSGETDFTVEDDDDVEAVETVVVELGSPLPSGLKAGATDHVKIGVGDNDAPAHACLTGTVLSDVKGYAKETGNGDAHVTRWKQALAAFGVSNGETAMTAATAQQNAGLYWAVRWDPVVTAIKCIEKAANTDPEIAVIAGSAVTEGGNAVFTVAADPAPTADLDVTVNVADDAAGDFLATSDEDSHTVTIPANQASATLTLSTTADTTDEANGSVTATVEAGTGYTVAAAPDDAASVAVTDDDATTVTLTTPDATAAEDDAADTAEITLTLGRGLVDGESLAVPLQFAGGAAGTLFTLTCPNSLPTGVICQTLDSAPQVTFTGPDSGASATAVTLSFAAQDDTGAVDETVTVSIPASSSGNAPILTATGLGGGATGTRTGDGQISITDNDVPAPSNPVSLSVSGNGAVDEGDPDPLKVTATLGTANATGSALAIPVQVRTAGTTAAAAADYTLAGTISIAAGASSGETDFTVEDDDDVEAVETVVVELGSPLPSGLKAGATDHVTIGVGDNDAHAHACLTGTVLSDVKGYAKETGSGAAHVVRWKQALAAFGVSNGETGMTVAEAQQNADDFWAVRWNPVVTALQCLENAGTNTDPEITVEGGSAIAEGGDAVFTVKASPAPSSDLDVTLDVADDAAGDFLATSDEGSHTVTIPANQASATLTLSTTGDSADEPNGSVSVTVDAGTGYTVAVAPGDAASVAVTDDDATAVVLTVPDTTAAEDDAADMAQITLTLGRGLADGESLAVPLQFAGGAAGTLFTLTCPSPLSAGVTCQTLDSTPQVTFAGPSSGVSATAVTLSFAAKEDAGAVDETVTVSIPASSSGNAPILRATDLGGGATGSRTGDGQIFITDNDAPASDACYAQVKPDVEGYAQETGNGTAHVTRWKRVLAAFGDQNGHTKMTVAEAQQNADDFWAVRWSPVVTALQCLKNAGTNTDPEITVEGGSAIAEGGNAVFTVKASPAPAANLAVTLTVDDDATSDFLAQGDEGTHTVTIPAGQSSATLTLATENDTTDEPDGNVSATVANGTGYTVGSPNTATVAVSDDDDPQVATPAVSIAAGGAITEGGNAVFTVEANPAPAANLVVTLTVDDDATSDFLAQGNEGTQTVTIQAGQSSATLTLATVNDNADEPDGRLSATVEAGTGYTVGGAATASVVVADDDDPVPDPVMPELRLSAGSAVDEGGNAVFTVHADAAPAADLTVGLTVSQTGDVLSAPGAGGRQLTLAAGTTSATLTLATADDGVDEPDGSVSVTLDAGAGYTVAAGQAAGAVAVRDNDEPVVSIAAGSGVTEGAPASFTLTANPAPHAALTVSLAVTQSGDYAASGQTGTRQVTIPAGGSIAFEVATVNDGADEPDGSVTATLAAGAGYAVAASPDDAASVAVADDDAAALPEGPSLSVNDVEVKEGPYRRVTFTVTLSEASDRYVSFYYRIRESSPVSAKRGKDFWAPTDKNWAGIRPGQTEYRIKAGMVIDDSHDEDPETFEVVLSDAHGAAIADGVGVATIVNDDPMPAAWLSRFGRTVAEQALDGIAGRMAAPRNPGVQGALAGQALTPGGTGTGPVNGSGAMGGSGPRALSGLDTPAGRYGNGGFGRDVHGFGGARTLTLREALLGSRFTATGGRDATGGSLAFWGRAAQSSFDGREGTFSLDGEATTGMLGADYARNRWMAGLALTHGAGKGDYADSGAEAVRCLQPLDAETGRVLCDGAVRQGDGKVEAKLTAAVPYASFMASERLRLWGAAGYGAGEVTLEPETGGSIGSDISWTMAAAGLRGELVAPPGEGYGPGLAVTSDALWTRTRSEKTTELASSDSGATRLRVALEGSWRMALGGGGSLVPRLEVGARHDGGDAETGAGMELGGGIAWSDPTLGLSLDLSGRALVAHGDDDLEDRGFAASVAFDPDPATQRGPSLTLRQDWGGASRGGLDALFASDPLSDRRGNEAEARWTAEAAWGFAAFGGRFTASPHAGVGLAEGARDYTLGWRLSPAANADAPDLSFGVKATRRESATAAPEHAAGFEVRMSW